MYENAPAPQACGLAGQGHFALTSVCRQAGRYFLLAAAFFFAAAFFLASSFAWRSSSAL